MRLRPSPKLSLRALEAAENARIAAGQRARRPPTTRASQTTKSKRKDNAPRPNANRMPKIRTHRTYIRRAITPPPPTPSPSPSPSPSPPRTSSSSASPTLPACEAPEPPQASPFPRFVPPRDVSSLDPLSLRHPEPQGPLSVLSEDEGGEWRETQPVDQLTSVLRERYRKRPRRDSKGSGKEDVSPEEARVLRARRRARLGLGEERGGEGGGEEGEDEEGEEGGRGVFEVLGVREAEARRGFEFL
ncbi:hypothetical protein BU16DRAFT_533481 [Lophium mytilinum]|uniref:Uncharacterized protein n=1 Tax=Lophium mytilinum TaxID=390894 RepID=A0A6A6RHG4_9PEZI|nr:hypothetical protein BU16DRAFT_533481 [Lophium mytilinum]